MQYMGLSEEELNVTFGCPGAEDARGGLCQSYTLSGGHMYKNILVYTRKYKLRFRMVITNICIAVLPVLLLGIGGYLSYVNILKQHAFNNIEQFVTQTNNQLGQYFDRIDQLSKAIFYNRNVQNVSIGNKPWQESDSLLKNLNSYISIDPTIKAVGMINYDDFRVISTGQLLTYEMINYVIKSKDMSLNNNQMQISHPVEMYTKEKGLLVFRKISSIQQEKYLQNIYFGVLLLDTQWIQEIMKASKMMDTASLYIVNADNEFIGSSNDRFDQETVQELIENLHDYQVTSTRINKVNYIVQSIPIHNLDWKCIAIINKDKLLEKATLIKYLVIIGISAMIIIVILVVTSFNLRLTYPITKMANAFDNAASGDLDAKLRFGYKDEITVIQDNYNNMLDQIKNLTENLLSSQKQLHEKEMEKQLFQLNGLQSQINSHFLYNVLHSIRGMFVTNAKKEATIAIDNLVTYFRYITQGDEYVLLYKELEHLVRYIDIQKIRFGERLQYKVDMDPQLQSITFVKLVLQPLVENALLHGLERKSGRWSIQIRVKKTEGNTVLIKVLDNGVGMSREKLDDLRIHLREKISPASSSGSLSQGIGLVNIHKRIQIYYGESYGLDIKSWLGRGTVVSITFPIKKVEGNDV